MEVILKWKKRFNKKSYKETYQIPIEDEQHNFVQTQESEVGKRTIWEQIGKVTLGWGSINAGSEQIKKRTFLQFKCEP